MESIICRNAAEHKNGFAAGEAMMSDPSTEAEK
mgnify:CR=1 FL=1